MPIHETKHCKRCDLEKSSEEFYRRRKGTDLSPYCKTCSVEQTVERQQRFKIKCVEYCGGSCEHCGYNKYIGALEFHHRDPTQKDFNIANARLTSFGERVIKRYIFSHSRANIRRRAALTALNILRLGMDD